MCKKYELTNESIEVNINGEVFTLHRIKALKDFRDVKAGELGGWIEKEYNLSHEGNAWVYDNAEVYGDAIVYDNAWVYDNARVYGYAEVYGDAVVCVRARIYDNAKVYGDAEVYGNAWVSDNARVFGNARVYGDAIVYDNANVYDNAKVYGDAEVYGDTIVRGNVVVCGNAKISSNNDFATTINFGFDNSNRTITYFRCEDGLVRLKCGSFYGTLDDFKAKVIATYGGSKIVEDYLMSVGCIVARLNPEE